ncbi:MAG: hypothetical protein J7K73_02940 [Nanoarchaeota archaeon]|nr:hypothetical protein [Nanoarchaeota archaeon]
MEIKRIESMLLLALLIVLFFTKLSDALTFMAFGSSFISITYFAIAITIGVATYGIWKKRKWGWWLSNATVVVSIIASILLPFVFLRVVILSFLIGIAILGLSIHLSDEFK